MDTPLDRTTVTVVMSTTLREHVAQYCATRKLSISQFYRETVARASNYDLSAEPKIQRRHKYATKEEAKQAQKKIQKERNELVARLLAEHRHKEHLASIEAVKRAEAARSANGVRS